MYRYKGKDYTTLRKLREHLVFISEATLKALYTDTSNTQFMIEVKIDRHVEKRKSVHLTLIKFNKYYGYNFTTITKAVAHLFHHHEVKRAIKSNSLLKDYQILQLFCLCDKTPVDWLIYNKKFLFRGKMIDLREYCKINNVRARTLYLSILKYEAVEKFIDKYLSEQH